MYYSERLKEARRVSKASETRVALFAFCSLPPLQLPVATTANAQFFPAINLCATAVYFSSGGMDKADGGREALARRGRAHSPPRPLIPRGKHNGACSGRKSHKFENPGLKKSCE